MLSYVPPEKDQNAFNCPICNVYAKQTWKGIASLKLPTNPTATMVTTIHVNAQTADVVAEFSISSCYHCNGTLMWYQDRVIYPDISTAPPPNPDLPQDIQDDYNEARSILNRSPRGAAALLRLCIQKLCKELGEPGNDINMDIGNLVKKGLPMMIQQALDTVRVIGNESVHPGQMALKDDKDTANRLFALVNLIAHRMITEPKEVSTLFGTLPSAKLQGIQRRDSNG
ncbi:MAG: DUF4145 domain-containing protein [Chloroflexota bacterium]|nr:DUF4145 domain-containing protein [Chloroflexota bacterium]